MESTESRRTFVRRLPDLEKYFGAMFRNCRNADDYVQDALCWAWDYWRDHWAENSDLDNLFRNSLASARKQVCRQPRTPYGGQKNKSVSIEATGDSESQPAPIVQSDIDLVNILIDQPQYRAAIQRIAEDNHVERFRKMFAK